MDLKRNLSVLPVILVLWAYTHRFALMLLNCQRYQYQNNRVILKKKTNQIDPRASIKNWIVKMLQIKICEDEAQTEMQSTIFIRKIKST